MRIAMASYPMLWQRTGGLQVQIMKTIESLRALGQDARLFDFRCERAREYDLFHVFAASNGNQRIVQEAHAQGVVTVLSPVLQPNMSIGMRLRLAAASQIAMHVSSYQTRTAFDDMRSAVRESDALIALSDAEAGVLVRAFGARPERVKVIPNGIAQPFFHAQPDRFLREFGLVGGFILVVGSISSYKNQLEVIRASAQTRRTVVLIGPIADRAYFNQCLNEDGDRVRYIGTLEHGNPLLASAYAAAAVTVLASKGEAYGLSAVESLAAGTPSIITCTNGLGIKPRPPLLTFVETKSLARLKHSIETALSAEIDREKCQALVRHLTWEAVGHALVRLYDDLHTAAKSHAGNFSV